MRKDHRVLQCNVSCLSVRRGNHFVFCTNQELTGVQIKKLLFVRTDCRHVVGGLKDTGEAGEIVEPKLGRSIDVIVGKSRQDIAIRVALHITPNMLFHFGKRTEQRCMVVAMVSHKIVVAHVRLAAKQNRHLDHGKLQYEWYSYPKSDDLHGERMQSMRKKARQYHHGDLKAAMIEAALQLVRKKGPRGFTLNEASRTAGVSVSAPYNHFKDKDALLIDIVQLGNRTLEGELRAAANTANTPRVRLLAVYLAYVAFAEHHPDLFAVMFHSGLDKTPYPEVHASAARAFDVARQLAVQIEPVHEAAEDLALAVWTMAHGFATLRTEGAIGSASSVQVQASAKALARRLLFPDHLEQAQ